MKKMLFVAIKIFLTIRYKAKSIVSKCQKYLFVEYGKDIHIGHDCDFYYKNIHIGNNVYIGNRASFYASISHIKIGNNVMFGPNVTIRGGNHRIDIVGKYMFDVKEKLPENDQDVIIEDDVWVGCNTTILKGVTIHQGSVIAAGAVVTKNVPPYAIVGGNPAKVIKFRFSKDQILEHKRLLKQDYEINYPNGGTIYS
jgi:acetyltransferase-like isoleucine patch superfamily enzyme